MTNFLFCDILVKTVKKKRCVRLNSNNFVVGRNSVLELLKNGSEVNFILCSSRLPREISRLASKRKIPVKYCDSSKINSMFGRVNHQGVIAQVASRKYSSVEDILNYAKKKNSPPFLIILDKIQDPHNFGAIARTAECMGAHGIIIGKRNCVSVNPTVEKCSCGALEYLKIARVDNLGQCCDFLKKNQIWICGTDAKGENLNNFEDVFKGPMALVIGSEGKGMSKSIEKKCDFIFSIPMFGKINSLNASVAAAIFMHKISEKRNGICSF